MTTNGQSKTVSTHVHPHTHAHTRNNSQAEESRAAVFSRERGRLGGREEARDRKQAVRPVKANTLTPPPSGDPYSILCFSSAKSRRMNRPISLILPSKLSPPSSPRAHPTLKTPSLPLTGPDTPPPSPTPSLSCSLHPSLLPTPQVSPQSHTMSLD